MEHSLKIHKIGFPLTFNFNLPLLLSGKIVSVMGSSIYNYAIALYVLKSTGSAFGFAATLVMGILPKAILNPFAGLAADRWSRKTLIVGMDILSGITVIVLYIYSNIHGLHLFSIYATAILLSAFSSFFSVAMDAGIPNLIENKNLNRVNSLNKGVDSFSNITGPILGGMIFSLIDTRLILLINGISFLLSAAAESFLDFKIRSAPDKGADIDNISGKNIMSDMNEGIIFIKSHKTIFLLFGYIVLINFSIGFGIDIPAPYIINNILKLSPAQFGIITGMCPLGLLVSSVILSLVPEFRNRHKVLTAAFAGLAVIIGVSGVPAILRELFSAPVGFMFYMAEYLYFGLIAVFVSVPLQTMLQRNVADEYRGRVLGLLGTFSLSAMPLGFIMSGFLVEILSPFLLTITAGVFLLIMVFKFHSTQALKGL